MRSDISIHQRISLLMDNELDLRSKLAHTSIAAQAEYELLTDVQRELDQCWDLLSHRQAALEKTGTEPAEAHQPPETKQSQAPRQRKTTPRPEPQVRPGKPATPQAGTAKTEHRIGDVW